MSAIKVIIADDHQIVREGIVSILKENPQILVQGEASNGKEVLELVKQNPCDVILMDINMPIMDGIQCTEEITKKYPEIKVIAFTMIKQNAHIKKILRAGAKGYILKTIDKIELSKAIKTVHEGEPYFSSSVSHEVMESLMRLKKDKNSDTVLLTEREKEVLQLIVNDKSNQEIAQRLNVSVRTIESHKQNLLLKTNTKSVAGLVVFALKNNLVDI